MNNTREKFDNDLNQLKNLKLSLEVKAEMKQKILSSFSAGQAPITPVASPYVSKFVFLRHYQNFALIFLVVFSFGSVFASGGSLPGDILYPIKTKVVEPIAKLTKTSEQAQIEYQVKLADIRIAEIKRLAEEKRTTADNIEKSKEVFNAYIASDVEKIKDKAPELYSRIEQYNQIILQVQGVPTTTIPVLPEEEDKRDSKKDRNRSPRTVKGSTASTTSTVPTSSTTEGITETKTNIDLKTVIPATPTSTLPSNINPITETISAPINTIKKSLFK